MLDEKIWTQVLTDSSIVIDSTFGLQDVAMKLVSGAGTYAGTLQVGNYASAPIPLAVGDPVSISAQKVISSLTIDCSGGGVIYIIGIRQ